MDRVRWRVGMCEYWGTWRLIVGVALKGCKEWARSKEKRDDRVERK